MPSRANDSRSIRGSWLRPGWTFEGHARLQIASTGRFFRLAPYQQKLGKGSLQKDWCDGITGQQQGPLWTCPSKVAAAPVNPPTQLPTILGAPEKHGGTSAKKLRRRGEPERLGRRRPWNRIPSPCGRNAKALRNGSPEAIPVHLKEEKLGELSGLKHQANCPG